MSEAAAAFTARYRVRFDEAGPDGCLRTSGLLRYVQDLASQHSESLGYDRAWYAERGLTWLVRAAELDIVAGVRFGSVLDGTTRVVGFRRVWSRRASTFALPDGSVAATVRIDWLLIGDRGTPTRIPAEFERAFGASPTGLSLGRVELDAPTAEASAHRFAVRPQELDPMDHVNNAVYADWLDEAIGTDAGRIPRRVRLEYAGSAAPGERLTATSWRSEEGWSVRVAADDTGRELLRAHLSIPG